MAPADFVQHIARAHTPIGDVGKIAQRAGVGTLVLSHIYPDDVAAEVWRDEAAKVFKGDIIVASDLTIVLHIARVGAFSGTASDACERTNSDASRFSNSG